MHPDDVRRDFGRLRAILDAPDHPAPAILTIHPTDVCNHRCPWCWFERRPAALDMRAALQTLDDFLPNGVQEIIVSGGGEPLLHRNIGDLIDLLASYRSVNRRLYTHGELLPRMRGRIAAAFDYVRISVDAGSASAYAAVHGVEQHVFHQLFSSAADLQQAGVCVGMSMVVDRNSIATVSQLVETCARHGIRYVFLKPVMEGMWRTPMPALPEFKCGCGAPLEVLVREAAAAAPDLGIPPAVAALSMTLTADDGVYPCCHLTSADWRIGAAGIHPDPEFLGRRAAVSAAYARAPHACRMHDAWRAWRNARYPVPQTAAMAQVFSRSIGRPLAALADLIASAIVTRKLRTIAVTGPSSVGKTTVAADIAKCLEARGVRSTTVSTDDFLRFELRGDTSYRRDAAEPLKPPDYAFRDVAAILDSLERGQSVAWTGYERGAGWARKVAASPAEVCLIEGLFLDSAYAAECLRPDLVLVLEAPSEAIANWRRTRDDLLRRKLKGHFRSSRETEEEIAQTIRAYTEYQREPTRAQRIEITVDPEHRVTAVHSETAP